MKILKNKNLFQFMAKKKLKDNTLEEVSGGIAIDELAQKTDMLAQKGDMLAQKVDMLEQKTDRLSQLDQKIDLLEQKTDMLDKKLIKDPGEVSFFSKLFGKKNIQITPNNKNSIMYM